MSTFRKFAEKPHFSPAEIGFFNESLTESFGQHVAYFLRPIEGGYLTGVRWWVDKTPVAVLLDSSLPGCEELCFVRADKKEEFQTFLFPKEKLPKDCHAAIMPLAEASWERLRGVMEKEFKQNLKRFKIRGAVRHFRSIGSGDFVHEVIVCALNAEHAMELACPRDYSFVTSPALVELK